jgi:hypothetical protein
MLLFLCFTHTPCQLSGARHVRPCCSFLLVLTFLVLNIFLSDFLARSFIPFPMTPVFPLFPDLTSEAQEAQVARLFLFPCRDALFSLDIPDFCFVIPLLICPRMQFGAPCTRTHNRSQYKRNNLFRRRNTIRPAREEWSTSTWNRRRRHRCVLRVRSISFLFWAGIYTSSTPPSLHNV